MFWLLIVATCYVSLMTVQTTMYLCKQNARPTVRSAMSQTKSEHKRVSSNHIEYDNRTLYAIPFSEPRLSILSKHLVVRRAYFDRRQRDGHSNAVVFLLEAERSVNATSFSGCRVGSVVSTEFEFRIPKQYDWAIENYHVTKNVALIDCYDIHNVKDGDPAFLKLTHSAVEQEVQSRQNLVVPQPIANLNQSLPTVVTCTATLRMGRHPPTANDMLRQWLIYQKTIGVDHVHMMAEDTFVSAGGLEQGFIQEAVKEGYMTVDFWPRWFNETEIYHSSQHLAYNDCLYRFQGVYDYVLYADYDDFFVPVGRHKSIKSYLKAWCSGMNASCTFHWSQFYPDCGWSPESVGADGNLTATVDYQKKDVWHNMGKSAHQLIALVDVGVHKAMVLMPGYEKKAVPQTEAYIAHLRRGRRPPGGC